MSSEVERMTKNEAIEALKACQKEAVDGDPEDAHSLADGVLCSLLRALGHEDVVKEWEAIKPKWYA
jgi:hypothetical protein